MTRRSIAYPRSQAPWRPYRPAFMVPYRLLPEIYGLKGQGYLGQSGVSVILLPGGSGADCKAKELVIYGYSNDTLPTTLSLFRWGSEKIGYASAHFQANVRLWAVGPANSADAMPGAKTAKPVMDVFTFNQLNQRSLLCSVRHFARTAAPGADGLPPNLDFQERPNDQTIDFCYGTPQDPAYPEGVVVALLRGQNPDKNETPTKDSYFMPDAQLPRRIGNPRDKPAAHRSRILSIDVPGSLGQYPPQGSRLGAHRISPTPCPGLVAQQQFGARRSGDRAG